MAYRLFIGILSEFSRESTPSITAATLGTSAPTVHNLNNEFRERMAEDIRTSGLLGGPGVIVEVDEAKFGTGEKGLEWLGISQQRYEKLREAVL